MAQAIIKRTERTIGSGEEASHLEDGGVEDVKKKLWGDADREHENGDRYDHELLPAKEIRKSAAVRRERSTKKELHGAKENDRGDEKAENSQGGKCPRQGE